jgi:Fe-S-cluster containining protein
MKQEPAIPTPSSVIPTASKDSEDRLIEKAIDELRREVMGGFLYTHNRANSNTSRLLETASFLYALIELLQEKGLLTIEELDTRKDVVAKRLQKRFLDKGMGMHVQEPKQDKYAVGGVFEVDCEARIHLCKGVCCRLWFPLSMQDVDEGAVRWDLRDPYIIAQDDKGYCKHLNRSSGRCCVYEYRPLPCRVFDCREDKRIWLDFANKEINPNLDDMFPKGRPDDT